MRSRMRVALGFGERCGDRQEQSANRPHARRRRQDRRARPQPNICWARRARTPSKLRRAAQHLLPCPARRLRISSSGMMAPPTAVELARPNLASGNGRACRRRRSGRSPTMRRVPRLAPPMCRQPEEPRATRCNPFIPMGFALDGEQGETIIESRGVRDAAKERVEAVATSRSTCVL
jgi:hypothetical protein